MIRAVLACTPDPDWPTADGELQGGIITSNPLLWKPLPRWTWIQGEGRVNASEAAFAAGAALFALDQVVRRNPPWLGVWRTRQALDAAATSARMLRLREDEGALRDAHHLTRPGDDPGPAGRLHRAWRELAARPARLDAGHLGRLAHDLGLTLAPNLCDRLSVGQGTGNPVTAGAEMAACAGAIAPAQRVDGEIFGLMLADVVLAQKLGWTVSVPLLATAILHPALKAGPEGRRPRSGDPDWATACQAAYARAAVVAHGRALDLARRADRLVAVAGKVRTRGGATGIAALLTDDAVTATALGKLGSDRAARRFLERLVDLQAIRELTGRSTFRLYGL